MENSKSFILVAIKGKMHRPVFGPAIAKVIGAKKAELMKSGNWSGYIFQIRNPDAYLKVPILTKKNKTYDEKRAA